ncbi:MAG: radical SAM protein [Firmicutes bacterium]|nr:radical SAM protein [Bacillota bacterium]
MGVDDNMIDGFKKNSILPDMGMGIVSISPVCGCSGGCRYCYLCLREVSKSDINGFGLPETLKWLRENPDFAEGEDGSILCLGSWGEIFPDAKSIRLEVYKWIEQLLLLENPMAIFTKGHLSAAEAKILYDLQKYPHQLMIFETVTSIEWAENIEPGCTYPEQRFQTLENCIKQGLDAVLYINPYLKGVTDADLEDMFKTCRDIKISDVIISPLFYNDRIIDKMAGCEPVKYIYKRLKSEKDSAERGMVTLAGQVVADEIAQDYPVIEALAEKYGLSIFNHYMCALSRQYGRKNTAFWGNAAICRDCGHCSKIEGLQ